MTEKTVEVNPTHLPVLAWMSQHSSRDAVTEWKCLGLSTDKDDAGLNDDDNPSPTEEMDATGDEAITDEWPGGPNVRVPREQRLRRPRLDQERREEDSTSREPGRRRREDEGRASRDREDARGQIKLEGSCTTQVSDYKRPCIDEVIKLPSDDDSLEPFKETLAKPNSVLAAEHHEKDRPPSSRSVGKFSWIASRQLDTPKPFRDKSADATKDHLHDRGGGEVATTGTD